MRSTFPDITAVPTGTDATVRPGDFILCRRKGFASACIRAGERLRLHRAHVSHAAFCETTDSLIEALTHGVQRTPLAHYRDIRYWHVSTGLAGDDQAQAVAFARSCIGQKYGFAIDASIALRFLLPGRGLWFGSNGTEICSGLVAQTQVRGWVNYPWQPASCSPEELYGFYAEMAALG